jgi:RNA polymerase sigma-70 factor (ECF subfamily)
MTEHAAQLIARLGERGATLAADPQLAPLLDGLFDRAEGRLPHRPIRRAAMVDRIADALLASDEPPDLEALTRLNASDLYLALALAAKDLRALEIAESELMPAVRQSIGRIDARASFVDEVSQRVRARLLVGDGDAPPAIMQYRGTGPLARWVRVIASRIALDLKRADSRPPIEREPAPAPVPAPADAELEHMWRTCADAYRAALAEAFACLPQRERHLLRQRYLEDLNADALGRLYRVTPATTVRWLTQIEERLAATTRAALVRKLALAEVALPSADRLEQLVASQLQSSLPRMLSGGTLDEDAAHRQGR